MLSSFLCLRGPTSPGSKEWLSIPILTRKMLFCPKFSGKRKKRLKPSNKRKLKKKPSMRRKMLPKLRNKKRKKQKN